MHRGKEVNTMGDFLPTINLGDEDRVKQMAVGDYFVCALRIDDELKCWGSNSNGQIGIGSTKSNVASMGDSLISTPFDSGKKIKQIFAGKSQMCILYEDSITVKCVGDNSYGQLRTGDKFNRGDSDLTTIPNITAIDLGTGELQIANVILSFKFVCIEFADKRVKCFGYNEEGNLGYNNFEDLSDKAGGIGSNLKFVDLFQSITLPTNNPTCSPT